MSLPREPIDADQECEGEYRLEESERLDVEYELSLPLSENGDLDLWEDMTKGLMQFDKTSAPQDEQVSLYPPLELSKMLSASSVFKAPSPKDS